MLRKSKIPVAIFGLLLLCVGGWLGLITANLAVGEPLNDFTRDIMASLGVPLNNTAQEETDEFMAVLRRNYDGALPPEAVAKILEPSVVQIISDSGPQASGVIVAADGTILTNHHVVARDSEVTVKLSDGRDFRAGVIGADPRTDLAVIRLIPNDEPGGKIQNLVAAKLGDSDKMLKAQRVLAFGAPYGLSQTVTEGIISAKERANIGIADYEDFLQTDAAINPGNSGGPLVNMRAEVIGINTAMALQTSTDTYTGIGFAIPMNMARDIMNKLIEHGEVVRGYFGIKIDSVGGKGALVRNVTPGSPADKAGLRTNDIIVEYDDKPLDSVARFRNDIALAEIGSAIVLEYYRGEEKKTASVVIEREPPIAVFDDLRLGITVRDRNYAEQRRTADGVVIAKIADDGMLKTRLIEPGFVIIRMENLKDKKSYLINNVSDYRETVKLMKPGESWRIMTFGRSVFRMLTVDIPE